MIFVADICPSEVWNMKEVSGLYPFRGPFWDDTSRRSHGWLPKLVIQSR